jgi:hypothetical protein
MDILDVCFPPGKSIGLPAGVGPTRPIQSLWPSYTVQPSIHFRRTWPAPARLSRVSYREDRVFLHAKARAQVAPVSKHAAVNAAWNSQTVGLKWAYAVDQARRGASEEFVMRRGDEARGDIGVVASLVPRPDGTLRLVLDDVVIAPSTGMTLWRVRGSYTFIDRPRDAVANMKLSAREYQILGENLVARLLARRSTDEFVSTGE